MSRFSQQQGLKVLLLAASILAVMASAAAGATERACFYYPNSGWGLWATRNVSCKTAKHVYNDSTKRIGSSGRIHRTLRVDGYRCRMDFDGGGSGNCVASHRRRIRFDVP